MKFENETIYIYGLFDLSGWCHYVGQTNNPHKRRKTHFEHAAGHFRCEDWIFQIIRKTDCENANRLEFQIGMAYKKRGQAECSVSFGRNGHFHSNAENVIYIEGYAKPFASLAAAGRAIGYSGISIKEKVGTRVALADGRIVLIDRKPIPSSFPQFDYSI